MPQTTSNLLFHKDGQFIFGGTSVVRGFAKIAVNFFLENGEEMKYAEEAIKVVKKRI